MNILFICRQNIFRSVAAHYLLDKFLKDNNITGINVASAGTEASYEPVSSAVTKALSMYGIDASHHKQRRLSKNDVTEADIIVVMGEPQKIFMKKYHNMEVPYYRMICCNEDEPVLDVEETADIHTQEDEDTHMTKTIKYIHDTIPKFYENMNRYRKSITLK